MDNKRDESETATVRFLRIRPVGPLLFASWIICASVLLSGCSVGYLLHLGEGQLRILCGREPVDKLLRTGALPPEQEEKVLLIQEAKTFGEKKLGLTPSKNYNDFYEVKTPPVAYNLTASPKLALRAYSWCFPIVGCLPYKGFFEKERALRSEKDMMEKGYDTYLRPVAAYSTLGWFKDPIFSTLLRYNDETLVEIILHEMVHGTVFLKGQGAFNEGVATFVGRQGTLDFFRERRGEDAKSLQTIREQWKEEEEFGDMVKALVEKLEVLYASECSDKKKLEKRTELFQAEKASFRNSLAPSRERAFSRVLKKDWNNAFLISYLTYNKDLALWEKVFRRFHGDLRGMVTWLKGLEGEKDVLGKINLWLAETGGAGEQTH